MKQTKQELIDKANTLNPAVKWHKLPKQDIQDYLNMKEED